LDQLLTANRFSQDLQTAEVVNCRFDQSVGVSRNHKNRDTGMPTPQISQQVETGFARHPVVADDEIEVVQQKDRKRFIHCISRLDRMALSFQDLLDRIPASFIVVCD